MKTGLVLEGGGMRGMFSVGVTDVLMEHGLFFDGIIGVSAGAAFGCNVKSRQKGRAIRYNTKYCDDPRFCSFRSLRKTGDLFSTEFCYWDVPVNRDPFDFKTFRATPEPFYVVCTDVRTGKAVYHRCGQNESDRELLDWIRASASMPLVSNVVSVGGYELLDGGIADSVPLRFFEKAGYAKNVVVLTQPASYVKGKNKALPLLRITERKHPELLKTLAERHHVYNDAVAYVRRRAEAGAAFVIQPPFPLDVGRVEHDREKLLRAYGAGRKTIESRLKALEDFLKTD